MNTPTKSLFTILKNMHKALLRIEDIKAILNLVEKGLNPAYRTFYSDIKAHLLLLGIISKSKSSEAWNRVIE